MPTLGELVNKFGQAAGEQSTAKERDAAPEGGTTKIASEESHMARQSLSDIYMNLVNMDKQAAQAAQAPELTDDQAAEMAEKIASAEATELAQQEEATTTDFAKVAAEYDSAGRIMARGFFDEFQKLAGALDTYVAGNKNTESPSEDKNPALGNRALPMVETNFAGSPNHDQRIDMSGGKEVYKDSLATSKKIKAGEGTGDDPEARAIAIGGGSPAGFATIRDLS